MKTLVSNYTFSGNGAKINVYAVEDEEGILPEDCLCLEFAKKENENCTQIYFRPDEALLIIKVLAEGMFKTVSSYEYGVLDETNT